MLGMEQMYKMALDPRIFPDSRLLAVMQGRDNSLPMAVAMAAKQQRDKLHAAAQGQEAQMGSKQPTVRDQMLAKDLPPEHVGLGTLPAENLANMDEQHMAGGGIIAFANTGVVPAPEGDIQTQTDDEKQQAKDKSDLKYGWEHTKAAARDILTLPGRGLAGAFETAVTRPVRAMGIDMPYLPSSFYGGDASSMTPHMDQLRRAEAAQAAQATPGATTQTINSTPTPAELAQLQRGGPQNPNAAPGAASSGAPSGKGGVGTPPVRSDAATKAGEDQGIAALTKRPDRFAGLGETQEAFDKKIAAEKNSAQGEFLMNMGLKMMTTVGPLGKAIGEGGMAGLPGLAANRKTINELEKNRKDYQFNMAKAQAALDQGDDELALKYKQLAEQSVYHSGLVAADMIKANAYAAGVGTKADIKDEKMNEAIARNAAAIHKENMGNFQFQSKFAKMSPDEQNTYFKELRNQAAALAGKSESVPKGPGARDLPSVGAVINGYKFKGGNPNDKNNWEAV